MPKIIYTEIQSGSREHKQELDLRGRVLRGELGRPPLPEIFPWDAQSRRYVAMADGRVIACLLCHPRIDEAKIFQMAVEKEYRGKGIGPELMRFLLEKERIYGTQKVFLHARHYVVQYYERLGFVAVGDWFEEIGMKHRRMERELTGP